MTLIIHGMWTSMPQDMPDQHMEDVSLLANGRLLSDPNFSNRMIESKTGGMRSWLMMDMTTVIVLLMPFWERTQK